MNNTFLFDNAENIPPPVANPNNVSAQEYSLQKRYCFRLSTLKFGGGAIHVEDEALADAEANLHNM